MPDVVELAEGNLVIDGIAFPGSIQLDRSCPECENTRLIFFGDYDSLACLECNIWLDPLCGEPDCPVCTVRPEFPLPLL